MQFCECHGHIVLDGVDFRAALAAHNPEPNEVLVRACLERYQHSGIRFFRDGGDKNGVSALAAHLAPAYGIDYRTPVFAIYKKGLYGGMVGRAFSDMAGFRALADEVLHAGGDFVKLMASGIMDFNEYGVLTHDRLSAEELAEAAAYVHSLGLALMVHVNGAGAIRDCILAGADSIEHGYYIDDDCLALLAQRDTVWVPTLAPVRNLIGTGLFPDDVLRRILDGHCAAIRKAASLGCTLALGSDAGAGHVLHCDGLFDEWNAIAPCFASQALAAEKLTEGNARIRAKFLAPGKRKTE